MTYVTSVERLGIAKGRAEGHAEGRVEGHAEGMQEGQLALVLRQLTRRCGELAPATVAQIEHLSMEQLGALAEALLDFSDADDLHAWLLALPPAE
jgi:predicted transposase YdaD